MATVLLDTDVFIDHLRGARRLPVERHDVAYSVVTRCELCAGARGDDAAVRELLAPFLEFAVDRPIAERAGAIRRATRMQTPDALIAATALTHGLALVTRNRRDFEQVPRLKVRAPR